MSPKAGVSEGVSKFKFTQKGPELSMGHKLPWKIFCLQLEFLVLTVKFLCLQSLKALIRRTFPL